VKDSEWIADLLRHGLIKGSFVPDRAQRELRELTRYRTSLVHQRTAVANRIQKTLEGANIKLGDVASDVLGQSGRAMIHALAAGESDPAALAEHARGLLKLKRPALREALRGSVGPHQRFLLRQQLDHIDYLDGMLAQVDKEVTDRLAFDMDSQKSADGHSSTPSSGSEAVALLDTIPGVGRRVAEILLSEIGRDMSRFPTADHLASWAGLTPGHRESAGKRLNSRTRKGNPALRATLVEAARAAARTKTYLGAQFHRLTARRGSKRAAVAVAHSILIIIYHLLRDGGEYRDLGQAYFDERDKDRVTRRLIQRLQNLGLAVEVHTAGA
jgi:transposase